jgi:hypothetical protein
MGGYTTVDAIYETGLNCIMRLSLPNLRRKLAQRVYHRRCSVRGVVGGRREFEHTDRSELCLI